LDSLEERLGKAKSSRSLLSFPCIPPTQDGREPLPFTLFGAIPAVKKIPVPGEDVAATDATGEPTGPVELPDGSFGSGEPLTYLPSVFIVLLLFKMVR
jgi:hypothetical protein